jgi:Type I restriction-modification system methyltransferase subunit
VTRRLLRARAELVAEAIDRLGIERVWQSLVAVHATRVGGEATSAILADLPDRDPSWRHDLLDGLTMGERSVLYEFSLAHADHDSRTAAGQFFTPDDVARFLAERAAAFPEGTWIDPCCGVGNLSYWLAASHDDPAAFVAERVVLVDRDPLALRIARALLATEFGLDADGYAALSSRSRVADALSDEFADDVRSGAFPAFDFALFNPPYVGVPRDDRFASAAARDLYAYFLERMLELGRGLVAITPVTFTSGPKWTELRRLLVRGLERLDLYCFDNVPDFVFRGVKFGSRNTNQVNSTRVAVIVGLAGSADAPRRHRITPLLRWRAVEREQLLASADDFLTELQPDEDRAFPKVSAALAPLFRELLAASTTVGDLLVREPTPYSLQVPIALRYYLAAVQRPLGRDNVHRLYFASAADRDRAWVVLNSSLAYWWWRVYEGGIVVSKALLTSVPVPLAVAPPELLAELARSEEENLVLKLNAGLATANVKHPWRVLRDLTAAVAPGYVDALLATHANTSLGGLTDAESTLAVRRRFRGTPAATTAG